MLSDLERTIQAALASQGMMRTLEVSLHSAQAGEVRLEMPVRDAIKQQTGFVHAGAITTLLDSACGYAAWTLMPAGSDVLAVEFKVNFVSPGLGERIRAVGSVVKAGQLITVTRGEAYGISSAGEKLIALMQATMIRR